MKWDGTYIYIYIYIYIYRVSLKWEKLEYVIGEIKLFRENINQNVIQKKKKKKPKSIQNLFWKANSQYNIYGRHSYALQENQKIWQTFLHFSIIMLQSNTP